MGGQRGKSSERERDRMESRRESRRGSHRENQSKRKVENKEGNQRRWKGHQFLRKSRGQERCKKCRTMEVKCGKRAKKHMTVCKRWVGDS